MTDWNIEAYGRAVIAANLLHEFNQELNALGYTEGVSIAFDIGEDKLAEAYLTPFPPRLVVVDEKPKVRYRVHLRDDSDMMGAIQYQEDRRFDSYAEAQAALKERAAYAFWDEDVFEILEVKEGE